MNGLYLHPAKRQDKAPSGTVLVSDTDNPEDGATLFVIDPSGIALSDDEAEAMAAEMCRRWNLANS